MLVKNESIGLKRGQNLKIVNKKKLKEYNPDLPVIVISSSNEIDDAITAFRLGAVDFVDWCSAVLEALVEAARTSSEARSAGVAQHELARTLFGEAVAASPTFAEST